MTDRTETNLTELAKLIDHTLLKPSAVQSDIEKLVEEGIHYGVACICVNPVWVRYVSAALENSPVKCCSVAGFPLGAHQNEVVAREAGLAVADGADEIDIVMNLGFARMGRWKKVAEGIALVKCEIGDRTLKVILEICELTGEQIEQASLVSIDGGADFIKTSTGFGRHGATVEAVRLMAKIADGKAGVKAAGGIRTLENLQAMTAAGATRIGTSSTVDILEQSIKLT